MALHSVEFVIRPSTLEEAWREKTKRGEAARFLAGGIDVVLYTPPSVTTLIDLAGLGLNEIRSSGGGVEIGATATMTSIAESEEASAYLDGFLLDVLGEVASPLQRNMATLGGSLAMAHPWSDVIPALLVLDAEAVLFDGSERTMTVEDLLAARAGGLRELPIIVGIRLPKPPRGAKGSFRCLTKTAFDVSLLNVACVGAVHAGAWSDVRISVGGTPALARRLRDVEDGLNGLTADREGISRVAETAAGAVDARDNHRASADYRRAAARALVARCLSEIAGLSKGHGS